MKESITYPMNAIQWETYEEWNQDRAMTEYNTTVASDLPREKVSADVLSAACQQVLDSQRYLHAHLVETDGEVRICEDWAMQNLVRRYTMTDVAWDKGKEELIQPFDLFHEPSVRLHVVDTETRTILIVETHHLLFDGISHKAVWSAIEDVLCGKEPYQQGDLAALTRIGERDYEMRIFRQNSPKYNKLIQFAVTYIGQRGKRYGYIDNTSFYEILKLNDK